MRAAYEFCKEGTGNGKDCFEFAYPITYTMPDGSTITVANKEDMRLIRLWYSANPGVSERPSLQYPVDIVFRDGTTMTLSSNEELRAAYVLCDKGRGGGRP